MAFEMPGFLNRHLTRKQISLKAMQSYGFPSTAALYVVRATGVVTSRLSF